MEHYVKGEVKEVPCEIPPNVITEENEETIQMRVLYGSKIWNLLGFAMKKIKEDKVKKIVWNGSGQSVTKTVTCAEIMKRKVKNLHQNTQVYYKRIEESWEPKDNGLDRLKVNRGIPAISILLSKEKIDPIIPGFQAPNSSDGLWAASSGGREQKSGKKRKQTGHRSEIGDRKESSSKKPQRQSGNRGDKKKHDVAVEGPSKSDVKTADASNRRKSGHKERDGQKEFTGDRGSRGRQRGRGRGFQNVTRNDDKKTEASKEIAHTDSVSS
ncbi:ribonuclease P protein subunit p25-like protein [Saccoglossus kowalevskii]|uniref:Ribonuclease P protein subunit p25-like protein-like n=1 Tax=Saccoglossus kowalevskii TaxID=10224 RepID=A0ABM0MVQ4_SACKO|nr:PREDICTED: ribonuclease P protein subunit p25-like protein-like [Saccoglossus kowalevskii]